MLMNLSGNNHLPVIAWSEDFLICGRTFRGLLFRREIPDRTFLNLLEPSDPFITGAGYHDPENEAVNRMHTTKTEYAIFPDSFKRVTKHLNLPVFPGI
jgi:hypothetical protein